MEVSKPYLFFRVSTLSHVEICSKRLKSETFLPNHGHIPYKKGSAMAEGTRLHKHYGEYLTDFERETVMSQLALHKVNGAFQKVLELPECYVVVRGDFDYLQVFGDTIKRFVSLTEVKTTAKKYMWQLEVNAAIRQLQLYLWLIKDYLPDIVSPFTYELYETHNLEVYSQVTHKLIKKLSVGYFDEIEDYIKLAAYKVMGLVPMNLAPFRYCMVCPHVVKVDCSYFQLRRET